MLDGVMLGSGPHPQGADVAHGDTDVDGDAQASDARINRHPCGPDRLEQVHLGVECPSAGSPASASMDCGIGAATRQE